MEKLLEDAYLRQIFLRVTQYSAYAACHLSWLGPETTQNLRKVCGVVALARKALRFGLPAVLLLKLRDRGLFARPLATFSAFVQIVFCRTDHLLFFTAIKLVRLQSKWLFEAVRLTRHGAWLVHCCLRVLVSYIKRQTVQQQLNQLVLPS